MNSLCLCTAISIHILNIFCFCCERLFIHWKIWPLVLSLDSEAGEENHKNLLHHLPHKMVFSTTLCGSAKPCRNKTITLLLLLLLVLANRTGENEMLDTFCLLDKVISLQDYRGDTRGGGGVKCNF